MVARDKVISERGLASRRWDHLLYRNDLYGCNRLKRMLSNHYSLLMLHTQHLGF